MNKDATARETTSAPEAGSAESLRADEVAAYLRSNPEFFLARDDLLVELSLPHTGGGKAVSLLERQITILRERSMETRRRLNTLLENAKANDGLFDTTKKLVLGLLKARDGSEIVQVVTDRLAGHDGVDACEMIVVEHPGWQLAASVRTESLTSLKLHYGDVLRLKRTHCGPLEQGQLNRLFPKTPIIRSTALCPVISHNEVLALLALGNRDRDYFNIHLDTLFLDFIGQVAGAGLARQLGTTGN